jgi:hypothetical protein
VKNQLGDMKQLADGLAEKAGSDTPVVVFEPVQNLDTRHADLTQLLHGLLADVEKGAESLANCNVS